MNRHPACSILLTFLSIVGGAGEALAQESLIPPLKRIQPAVVTIIAYDEKGEVLQQGSGFFITKVGYLVTNRHVLYGASRAEVKTQDGTGYAAVTKVVAEDKEGDLVQVVTDMPRAAVRELPISGVVPEVGERVVVVGSPLGLEQTVSEGIVSAVRDIPGFGIIVQITAPISSGSSGSPVVNLKGEVIGIATLQLVQGQNLNFAVPGARVLALKPGKGWTLAEWTAGVTREWAATAEGLYFTGLRFIGDCTKALPYFEEAVQRNPRYAEAWFFVGYCNGELGRYQEEVTALRQAIRLKPDDADAHYILGVTYGKLGRYQEEVAALRQAIRLKPDDAGAHYSLGIAYGNLQRWQQAVAAFKQAIRLKPDNADAHVGLGWAYSGLRRPQEALDAFKQAIRLKPDDADAHDRLGWAYSGLRRPQEALDAFKQAIRLKPDLARAHLGLGMVYFILDDKGSALEEYKILKTLDPDTANKLFNLIYE